MSQTRKIGLRGSRCYDGPGDLGAWHSVRSLLSHKYLFLWRDSMTDWLVGPALSWSKLDGSEPKTSVVRVTVVRSGRSTGLLLVKKCHRD